MASQRTRLVAIGNFDGVHRGHQAVLQAACEQAELRALTPTALTFHPHPAEVVGRGAAPLLTTVERKVELLEGLDPRLEIRVQRFDRELASRSPEEFTRELLVNELDVGLVLVGENFRFGRQRAGDLETLRELGQKYGFEARAERITANSQGVFSSTRARNAIQAGDLAEATEVLGRPHMISGLVSEGQKRGRTIGFPTANLAHVPEVLPPDGVYLALVDVDPRSAAGGRPAFEGLAPAVMNLGSRPTFGAGRSIEAHLLDFSGDLYGLRLRCHLVSWIRDEQRFDGVDALRGQIERDVETARRRLLTAG